MAAMFLSEQVAPRAIVALTESGATAQWLSRYRSAVPIYALSRREAARRRMLLLRDVVPVEFDSLGGDATHVARAAIQHLYNQSRLAEGDRVILTHGDHTGQHGGTNTLNAMFRYPDVFHVGVAVAPVPDQQLYDTIYQERYMGLPSDNADGYKRGSAINFAEGLKGRLLVIHGSGDDNVHYQGTERLINRIIELRKPVDMMVYPNRSHAINEGPGTSVHVYRSIARYFLQSLPPGAR